MLRVTAVLLCLGLVACEGDPVGEAAGAGGQAGSAGASGGSGGTAASGSGGTAGAGASGGSSGEGGVQVVVPLDADGATRLAVDASDVFYAVSSTLHKVPKQGGTSAPLAQLGGPAAQLIEHGDSLYAIVGKARLVRVDKLSGNMATLAQGANFDVFGDLASDGQYVYWTHTGDLSAGSILRVSLTGGSPQLIASNNNAAGPQGIALAGADVYWVTHLDGALHKAPVAGGTQTWIQMSLYSPWDLTLSGKWAYWSEKDGGVSFLDLNSAGSQPVSISGSGSQAVVSDDSHVYWTEQSSGKVLGAELGQTFTFVVAEQLAAPQAIALDDSHVYFTSFGQPGSVLRVKK